MKTRDDRPLVVRARQRGDATGDKPVVVLAPAWLATLLREIAGRVRAGEGLSDILRGLVPEEAASGQDAVPTASLAARDAATEPDGQPSVDSQAELAKARAELLAVGNELARCERYLDGIEADLGELRRDRRSRFVRFLGYGAVGLVLALMLGFWLGKAFCADDLSAAGLALDRARVELERAQDLTLELLSRQAD